VKRYPPVRRTILPVTLCVLAAVGALFVSGSIRLDDGFTFFLLADPQFGMMTGNKDFSWESRNFEKAVAAANRLKPAFVMVLGDLVNREGDPAQIAEFRRIAGTLDRSIPLYQVPGNHDLGNLPTVESLAEYRRRFGPDYFSFETGGVVCLALDTSLIKPAPGLAEEKSRQRKWLEEQLRKASERKQRVFLFQHIAWCLKDADEPDAYENIGRADRRDYLALLESSPVTQVFAGHRHMNGRVRIGRIEEIIVGPVGKNLGSDPPGVGLVKVAAAGVVFRYVSLDDLSNLDYKSPD